MFTKIALGISLGFAALLSYYLIMLENGGAAITKGNWQLVGFALAGNVIALASGYWSLFGEAPEQPRLPRQEAVDLTVDQLLVLVNARARQDAADHVTQMLKGKV